MLLECIVNYDSYYNGNVELLALPSIKLETCFLERMLEFWMVYRFQFVALPGALYTLTIVYMVGNDMLLDDMNAGIQVFVLRNNMGSINSNNNNTMIISNKNAVKGSTKTGTTNRWTIGSVDGY